MSDLGKILLRIWDRSHIYINYWLRRRNFHLPSISFFVHKINEQIRTWTNFASSFQFVMNTQFCYIMEMNTKIGNWRVFGSSKYCLTPEDPNKTIEQLYHSLNVECICITYRNSIFVSMFVQYIYNSINSKTFSSMQRNVSYFLQFESHTRILDIEYHFEGRIFEHKM